MPKIVTINTILFKSPPLVDAEPVVEPVTDGDCVDMVAPVSAGIAAVCEAIASPTLVTIVKLEYSASLKQVGLTSQ